MEPTLFLIIMSSFLMLFAVGFMEFGSSLDNNAEKERAKAEI